MSNEIELYNKSQLSKYEDAKEDLDKIMIANLYPSARDTYDIAKKQGLDLTMKQVKHYLQSQTPYQLTHENHQTKASMGYMVSFSPWSITQIDLLDLSKYSYDYSQFKSKKKLEGIKTDFNNGYKYVLIFIDIFSRYVDVG